MREAKARTAPEGPDTSKLPGSDSRKGSSSPPEGGEERHQAPDGELGGLLELAARVEALGARARAEAWPGFTAEDGRVLHAAARELATFEEALAQGMREAFAIGREHREREALLDRLNHEIAAATSRLAQEAWGARRRGSDG